MQNIHAQFQIDATRALLKFMSEHNGGVDPDLTACLAALEADDIALAVTHAKRIKPHGMGGLTDWFPPAVYPHEDRAYVSTYCTHLSVTGAMRSACHFPRVRPNNSFKPKPLRGSA